MKIFLPGTQGHTLLPDTGIKPIKNAYNRINKMSTGRAL
jgi:hypothetical protein